MQQFTLDYDGIDKLIRARQLRMGAILVLLAICWPLASSLRSQSPFNLQTFLIMSGAMVLIVAFIIYAGSNQYRRLLESYTITFEDNIITREQYNTSTITFPIAEIIEIARDKKGFYRIKAESWDSYIEIPAHIDDADKLYTLLNNIRPVIEKNSHTSTLKKIAFIVAAVSFLMLWTSTDKIVIASCGLVWIVGMIYSYINTQRNHNIDYGAKSKWSAVIIFALIIRSIYYRLIE